MNHKEKRLEYARQYQSMKAKSCLLGRKEIQFRRSRWLSEVLARKKNPEENCSTRRRISYDLGAFLSSGKLKLQFVSGRKKAADYVKMLNDLSLAQEGQQQKIRLLDHPACSLNINPIEKL